MRRFMFAAAAGLALAFVAAVPAQSQASWLSEALHRRFDPGYYAPPVYSYGDYYAPPVYYSTPYYEPVPSFYWSSGPRYYGHYYRGGWHGDRDGWHGDRHGYRGGWHGGREHHHR